MIILYQFLAVYSALAVVDTKGKVKQHSGHRDEYHQEEIRESLIGAGGIVNDPEADEYQDDNIDDIQN
jgi:hypothetical protein